MQRLELAQLHDLIQIPNFGSLGKLLQRKGNGAVVSTEMYLLDNGFVEVRGNKGGVKKTILVPITSFQYIETVQVNNLEPGKRETNS